MSRTAIVFAVAIILVIIIAAVVAIRQTAVCRQTPPRDTFHGGKPGCGMGPYGMNLYDTPYLYPFYRGSQQLWWDHDGKCATWCAPGNSAAEKCVVWCR